MKVYNYDQNGYYLTASDAQPSPLEPGEFLVPANATSIAPPNAPVGQIACFVSTAWVLKPDPAKMTDAQKVAAGLLEVPQGYIVDATSGSLRTMTGVELVTAGLITLAQLQTGLKNQVDGWLAQTLNNGFPYNGFTSQADITAQTIALGSVVMGANDPTYWPFQWRNKANTFVSFASFAAFQPFVVAMKTFVDSTYSKVFATKAAIDAATTATAALAAFTSGTSS